MNFTLYASGILLSGGVIVVWLLTHLIIVPFASDSHPFDVATAVTKLAEMTAFAIFPGRSFIGWRAAPNVQRFVRAAPTIIPVFGGFLVWGSGMLVTILFPGVVQMIGHSHAIP